MATNNLFAELALHNCFSIKRQLLWPVSDSYFGRSGTESSFLYSMVLDLPDVDAFFR